jgi:hypothetical protein
MIGFKVSLNNNVLFTAAHQDAMYISAGAGRTLGNDDTWLGADVIYAIESKDGLPKAKEAFWVAPKLHVGDEVLIVVVDTDKPSPATYKCDHGVKSLPYYDAKEGVCSFCGAAENEELLVFERAKGKICASCVKFYSRLLEHID